MAQNTQKTAPAAAAPQPVAPLHTKPQPAGGLSITFQMPADVAKRVKLRAGTMPVDRYIWEQIIRPAIYGHVY